MANSMDAFRVLAVPPVIEGRLELNLDMTVAPQVVKPGQTVTITHTLSNTGTLSTSGILHWQAPNDLVLLTVPPGCTTDSAVPGRVTCAVSGLAPSAFQTWEIITQVTLNRVIEREGVATAGKPTPAQIYGFVVPGANYQDALSGSIVQSEGKEIIVELGSGIRFTQLWLPFLAVPAP